MSLSRVAQCTIASFTLLEIPHCVSLYPLDICCTLVRPQAADHWFLLPTRLKCQLMPSAGDSMGRSVSHCRVLVGSCCPDSFHCCPVPGDQLLPQQEALEAPVVQQCFQQHSMVYLCQGGVTKQGLCYHPVYCYVWLHQMVCGNSISFTVCKLCI